MTSQPFMEYIRDHPLPVTIADTPTADSNDDHWGCDLLTDWEWHQLDFNDWGSNFFDELPAPPVIEPEDWDADIAAAALQDLEDPPVPPA